MIKKTIWAIIAVFIAWSILDFLIHGLLLKSTYQATADLWRPDDEMKMPLMSMVTLIVSICFVAIYSYMIKPKSFSSGLKFGWIFGLATGVSMGFGSDCDMPIPFSLALSWFIGSLIEITVAGAIVGVLIKPSREYST
jgi:hypothetical protein